MGRQKGMWSIAWKYLMIFGFLVFFGCVGVSFASHHGSAENYVFALSEETPDARILVNTASKIVVINVHYPTALKDQEGYKVSLELVGMQICEAEDKLKIICTHPKSLRTKLWQVNTTSPEASDPPELKDIEADQIVLIPEGRWIMSSAEIVATLYHDAATNGSCPANTVPCSCDSGNTLAHHSENSGLVNKTNTFKTWTPIVRCIPNSLVCNGNPNCGVKCLDDESTPKCHVANLSPFMISASTMCQSQITTTTIRNEYPGSATGKLTASLGIMLVTTFLLQTF